jgi:hypothetical protein
MHVTMSDRNAKKIVDVLDYSEDNTHSQGVNLAGCPILGLLVPVLDTGPVMVEISIDGSNWYALKNADGSNDAVNISGGGTAFFVSSDVLTPLAAYTAHLRDQANDVKVRLKTGAAQTADRTFIWIGGA